MISVTKILTFIALIVLSITVWYMVLLLIDWLLKNH
jgi:hypothetical protein